MMLRITFTRENGELFSDNIPAYCDWIEKRLAKVMVASQGEGSVSERMEDIKKIIG